MKSVFNISVAPMWEASPAPVLCQWAFAFILAITPLTNAKGATPPKRVCAPQWTPDVLDVFFTDARTKLVGNRPDYDKPAPVAAASTSPNASPTEFDTPPPTASAAGWSKLIDAETIETEVKRLSQELAKTVTAPLSSKVAATKTAAASSVCWPHSSQSLPNMMAKSAGKTRPPRSVTSSPRLATTAKSAPIRPSKKPRSVSRTLPTWSPAIDPKPPPPTLKPTGPKLPTDLR